MPASHASLPYGVVAHNEQTDASALEQRVWKVDTTMLVGFRVITVVMKQPPPDIRMYVESVAGHMRTCRSTSCRINGGPYSSIINGLVDAEGKFNPSATVFLTTALDPDGSEVHDLGGIASDCAAALKNHNAAVLLFTGSIANWAPVIQGEPA